MTYDTYRYIFIGATILCVLMVVLSVLLFILLKIPSVIGDLTGATARKAIEQIRKQNELTGDKTYKSSVVNKERGKVTDKISPSGKIITHTAGLQAGAMETEKIGESSVSAEETSVLCDNNDTTVLTNNETTILDLNNETTLLEPNNCSNGCFCIIREITFIHTDEVIM